MKKKIYSNFCSFNLYVIKLLFFLENKLSLKEQDYFLSILFCNKFQCGNIVQCGNAVQFDISLHKKVMQFIWVKQ